MRQRNTLQTVVLALSLLLTSSLLQANEAEPEKTKKGIGDSIGAGVNALNKVGGGLLSKVGGVASKVANLKDVKPPASVAVLPATGAGTPEERSEIRIALHNSLGATNIRSLKPGEVDRLLVVAEQTTGQTWDQIPKKELTSIMAVEGLLLVDVEKVDRLYAGAYAHYEVGVKASLYTSAADKIVWDKAETEAERKGGVSINPLGMIATAISSARILTDAVRQVLVNTLARRIAADIPQPSTFLKSKKPIIVDMAVSNGVEGPFSVGDEITVLAKAEPGLVMFFDINGLSKDIALDEKAEGEYIGSYVVAKGNDADSLFISLKATRVQDKAKLTWRVPGKLKVDTIPPGDVSDFRASSTSEGVALSWQPPQGENLAGLSYRLERASVSDGVYQVVGDVAITEYQDSEVAVGDSYYYRIRSIDDANNEGSTISRKVSVFKPGPTELSGLLEGQISYPAIGNPYRLSDNLTVTSGAEISFEEGTIVELSQGQKITVQGSLTFNGSSSGQVTVRGDGWNILYDGAGASASAIRHARLSGLNAKLTVAGSNLAVENVISDGVTVAVEQYGKVGISASQMLNAEPALRLIAGELSLADVRFTNNEQAIVNADTAGQSSLVMSGVVFERNKLALSTQGSYELSGVSFPKATLNEIQDQLDGPITLDWSAIGGGKDLIRTWLAPNMLALKQALKRQDWTQASTQIKKMRQVLPSDGIERLESGLAQADKGFAKVSYGNASNGLGSLLAEGNRTLWIQNETLPSAQAKSEELSERAMLRKFGKSYVKEMFPNKGGGELAKAIRGIDVSAAVDASQYLYSVNKGLLSEVWMAHVINQSALSSALSSAGLGSSKGSNNVFAVSIDNTAASNIVLDLLENRNIRYKVSRSGKSSPYRLSANVVVSDSESQISKNLKVAEATIRLRLEEVQSSRTLGSWKAVGSASAFGKSDAHKQALQAAIKKIESAMIKKLWAVDSRPASKQRAAAKKPAPVAVAPKPVQKPAPKPQLKPVQPKPEPKSEPVVVAKPQAVETVAVPVTPEVAEPKVVAKAEVEAPEATLEAAPVASAEVSKPLEIALEESVEAPVLDATEVLPEEASQAAPELEQPEAVAAPELVAPTEAAAESI